jgi:mono/diheme cytochrome c family protein
VKSAAPIVLFASALAFACVAVVSPSSHVAASSEAKTRGQELFATKGCAHCHGPAGVGGTIGPDLQLVRKRMNAAEITKQIHDGSKSMPAFGEQLSNAEIKDLVAYLRAKRHVIKLPPAAAPTKPVSKDGNPGDTV